MKEKRPFVPFELPLKDKVNPLGFINELVKANTKIGIYNTLLNQSKINKRLLIAPIALQEAVLSTKIEGTQVTVDDVLESKVDDKAANEDIQEVFNYANALVNGKELLERLPISTRLIKELHKRLLDGNVRGNSRAPGEFRQIQNFIGPEGCTIKNASFIPPEPQLVEKYISNLENYINYPQDDLDPLVKIAIIHAQFETIHPFLDGNGRIGRILIPLYLFKEGIIDEPNFFLSESLEKDKHKYYRLLNDTREEAKWNEWIKFFLESSIKQADKNIQLISEINSLYERDLEKVKSILNTSKVTDIMDVMFEKPIFNAKIMSEMTGINITTIRRYLLQLENEKIIFSDDKLRNRKYYYYDLIDNIEDKRNLITSFIEYFTYDSDTKQIKFKIRL